MLAGTFGRSSAAATARLTTDEVKDRFRRTVWWDGATGLLARAPRDVAAAHGRTLALLTALLMALFFRGYFEVRNPATSRATFARLVVMIALVAQVVLAFSAGLGTHTPKRLEVAVHALAISWGLTALLGHQAAVFVNELGDTLRDHVSQRHQPSAARL